MYFTTQTIPHVTEYELCIAFASTTNWNPTIQIQDDDDDDSKHRDLDKLK